MLSLHWLINLTQCMVALLCTDPVIVQNIQMVQVMDFGREGH